MNVKRGHDGSEELLFIPGQLLGEQNIAPADAVEKLNEQARTLHDLAMNLGGRTIGNVKIEADPENDITTFRVEHARDQTSTGVPGYPVRVSHSAFWDRYTLFRKTGEAHLTLGHEACRKAADEDRLAEVTLTSTVTPLKFGAKRWQRVEDGRLDSEGEILPDTRTTHEPKRTNLSPDEAKDVKDSLNYLSEMVNGGPRRKMSGVLARLLGPNTIHRQ